jgi:hypothetical protein
MLANNYWFGIFRGHYRLNISKDPNTGPGAQQSVSVGKTLRTAPKTSLHLVRRATFLAAGLALDKPVCDLSLRSQWRAESPLGRPGDLAAVLECPSAGVFLDNTTVRLSLCFLIAMPSFMIAHATIPPCQDAPAVGVPLSTSTSSFNWWPYPTAGKSSTSN